MKSILKRIFVTLLTLLLLFSIAGCGQQGTIPSTTDTSTPKPTEKNVDNKDGTKKPVEIQFWHNYDAGAGQIDVLNLKFYSCLFIQIKNSQRKFFYKSCT